MGFQDVEMVLEVEEAFDISIDDTEAAAVATVGDLCELVRQKFEESGRSGTAAAAVCRSARVFYSLRRYLIDKLGVPRESVRRDADVSVNCRVSPGVTGRRKLGSSRGMTFSTG